MRGMIPRSKAISMMFMHAQKKGWDEDTMDQEILKTGIVENPSISCMIGRDISNVLYKWGYTVKVEEPTMVYKLLKKCEMYDIPWAIVIGTIGSRLGKKINQEDDRDLSVYHLLKWEKKVKKRYLWILIEKVVQFYIDNPDKLREDGNAGTNKENKDRP